MIFPFFRSIRSSIPWRILMTSVGAFLLVGTLMLTGCVAFPEGKGARGRAAEADRERILIGACSSWKNGGENLWRGIKLALDEVNGNGGVLGRRLEILQRDDEMNVTKGLLLAQELMDQPSLIAVLGHWHSFISESTSLFYESNGVVNISYAAGDRLTQRGLGRFFRLASPHGKIATTLGKHLMEQGMKRVVVFNYVRDGSNFFADAFEREASQHNLQITERFEFDSAINPEWLRQSISRLKRAHQLDAVFLAGRLPQAGEIIKALRLSGCNLPIFSGRELISPELSRQVGSLTGTIGTVSLFPPPVLDKVAADFSARFQKAYEVLPDEPAALGYDSVMLLVKALQEAGAPDPKLVAEKLHALKNWTGVTGTFGFDDQGNVVGRTLTTCMSEWPAEKSAMDEPETASDTAAMNVTP